MKPNEEHTKEKKHAFMYHSANDNIHRLVCVPVDSLISPTIPFRKFELHLPPCTNNDMSCIDTIVGGKQALFCFGGTRGFHYPDRRAVAEVYRYDLTKLPETVLISECKDMIHGMCRPLLMQVGHGDFIYALGLTSLPYAHDNDFAFLEYNVKKNEWIDLLGDKRSNFNIVKFDCDDVIRHQHNLLPHVVIGHKLHISLGNSSFTFDTLKRVWEDCKLFETFWSENKGKCGLTPSYPTRYRESNSAAKVTTKYGGPPFGFYGRAICWDDKILLGVPYTQNGPLNVVAFLLDDEGGRVVNSQPLSLAIDSACEWYSSNLVDLGRDGYFGLVHIVQSYDDARCMSDAPIYYMKVVTFKVSRRRVDNDDDDFLDCLVVAKETVLKNCYGCDRHMNSYGL